MSKGCDQITAERIERRKAGPLYPTGHCQMCDYKVPPKALWCCGECAQDYAAETRELDAKGRATT